MTPTLYSLLVLWAFIAFAIGLYIKGYFFKGKSILKVGLTMIVASFIIGAMMLAVAIAII